MSNPAASDSNNSPPTAQVTSPQHADPAPKPLAATGRSKTAPLQPLDELWTAAVDIPQLSERDSIFATTYRPSHSPPSLTPGLEQPQDVSKKSRTPARRYNSVTTPSPHQSLAMPAPVPPQSTPPARNLFPKQQQYPALKVLDHLRHIDRPFFTSQTSAQGMGSSNTLHEFFPGLSPVSSPFDRPTTPETATTANIHTVSPDRADDEERYRYRSWREGKASIDGHLLKANPRSQSKEPSSRVDSKIQATLPKADPPATVARSRKASQYLGLFKEKDAAEEHKRRREKNREQSQPGTLETPALSGGLPAPNDNAVVDDINEDAADSRLSRNRPNLPFQRGSDAAVPTSSSINIGQTLSPQPSHQPDEVSLHGLSGGVSLPAGEADPSGGRNQTEQTLPGRDRSGQLLPGDEEEESDHEQIKSALYFPHRQVLPGPVSVSRTTSFVQQKIAAEKLQAESIAALPEISTAENASQSPNEVEISLQSQDESQCWHGDLHDVEQTSEDLQDYSSTYENANLMSDSEPDSGAESARSAFDYDSDDDLMPTPTAFSTKRKQPHRQTSHRHLQDYSEPRGAVELKPFKHQVGGHSTVYRFSRRAVCKQLNNRENVFYETVERYHPELLEFLPR